jgi:hypothetical protein
MIVGVMIQKWNGNIPLILSKMVLDSVTGIYPPEINIKLTDVIGQVYRGSSGWPENPANPTVQSKRVLTLHFIQLIGLFFDGHACFFGRF